MRHHVRSLSRGGARGIENRSDQHSGSGSRIGGSFHRGPAGHDRASPPLPLEEAISRDRGHRESCGVHELGKGSVERGAGGRDLYLRSGHGSEALSLSLGIGSMQGDRYRELVACGPGRAHRRDRFQNPPVRGQGLRSTHRSGCRRPGVCELGHVDPRDGYNGSARDPSRGSRRTDDV